MKKLSIIALLGLAVGCGGISGNEDSDGDGITNDNEGWEQSRNTDGDSFEDWLDLDSDGDGLSDQLEAGDNDLATPAVDSDEDGTPDFQDLDSDNDGVDDSQEIAGDGSTLDTDADGTADHLDDDSDDDGIPDSVELTRDSDNDGQPDLRSLDSDGDCIPDALEAGPNPTAPLDTDGDNSPDYRDLDSDNDGIPDKKEDLNCNGILDPGESSPVRVDTDGDGTPDLVETVAGSDPNDPNENIPDGDFYFVLPFMGPGDGGELDFATTVQQADIFFSVDTTGSFGQEITAIQSALESTIVPGVTAVIPNAAFGVGRFEDLPLEPFGLPGDLPYESIQTITTLVSDIVAALGQLAPATGGLDIPEAGFEALFQWATGQGMPAFGYPATFSGGIGGVGFRKDSLPIIVHITDAISHLAADYPVSVGAHTRAQAVSALNGLEIRVIGVNSLENQGTANDPGSQLEAIAIATSAVTPPDGNNQCLTGVAGAAKLPVDVGGGNMGCPLVFDVLANGSGLGSLIVDAIVQLATFGVLDISTETIGALMGLQGETLPAGTTTADFISSITPVAPAPAGATIDALIFRNVTPGSVVTFDVQAFNDFVEPTDVPQLFSIDLNVVGDQVTLLDIRRVFVVVPEVIVGIE